MSETPDAELLQRFVRNQSEAAFAELVERHVGLVYSAALRKTDNPQHAQDVAQAVFIILARKAGSLGSKTVLPGWLYHTARLTAANLQRVERRRFRREQEAFMQSTINESAPDALWRELSPLLEDGMAGLGATDRDAIVLRFFQNRSLAEVGAALGASEDAARMRVNRALESLRKFFNRRGVVSTTAVIAGVLFSNSVQAAPVGLAKTISTVALTKATAASASTLTLAKGALKFMAWTNTKTAIAVGIGLLVVAGSATIAVKGIDLLGTSAWQKQYNLSYVDKLPPQVKIVPSLPSTVQSQTDIWGDNGKGAIGLGLSVMELFRAAYGVLPNQLIWKAPLAGPRYPWGAKYDFIANLPNPADNVKVGREKLQKMFGLTARISMIQTNVLILTVQSSHAPGLHRATLPISHDVGPGFYSSHDGSLIGLDSYLGQYLNIIIVDQTQLYGDYDIDFKWDNAPEGLKRALLDKTGLELTPTNMTVQMVVVEPAK